MKFLVTAAGGDIAQTVLKIIRNKFPDSYIIGTDTKDNYPGRIFTDKFIIVPNASDHDYLEVITSITQKESIDIILPINENELIRWINEVIPSSFLDMKTVRARGSKLLDCFDKYSLNAVLKEAGFQVPWSILPDVPIHSYPAIFKHRIGSGSKGMSVIKEENHYRFVATRSEGMFFQEILEPSDEEYTCGVYRNKQNESIVLPLKRQLMGGLTGFAEVVMDEEIINYCKKIIEFLDIYGSINIQLIKSKQGPKLFEINPRFSSTAGFRHHLGFQDVVWSIEERLGNEYSLGDFEIENVTGEKFLRVYEEIYLTPSGKIK